MTARTSPLAAPLSRPRLALSLSLALLAPLAVACGPVDPEINDPDIPDQATACAATVSQGDVVWPVALGAGPAEDFKPYSDGEVLPKITGGQGLSMITPLVRVEPAAGDLSEICLRVRIEEVQDGFSAQWNVLFVPVGGALFSDGALYYPTPTTGPVDLLLTVEGDGLSGTADISVVLE
ncbi:MAG: hypothetical protein R3F14_11415 [Polyangiaceae bacterium]